MGMGGGSRLSGCETGTLSQGTRRDRELEGSVRLSCGKLLFQKLRASLLETGRSARLQRTYKHE